MNHLKQLFVTCLLALYSSAFAQSQPAPPPAPPFGTPISYAQAKLAAEAAMKKAADINVPNSVAVVEPSGDLVYFIRMDGAPYSATQLSQQKAWTAARYRRPTKAFFDGVEGGHPFFLSFPDLVNRVLLEEIKFLAFF